MARLTQSERILRHIRDHGYITTYDAVYEYGILSLSRRICDLEEKGYAITKEQYQVTNRYGEKRTCIKYALAS